MFALHRDTCGNILTENCQLIVVEGLESPNDPWSYVVEGSFPLVGSPKAKDPLANIWWLSLRSWGPAGLRLKEGHGPITSLVGK